MIRKIRGRTYFYHDANGRDDFAAAYRNYIRSYQNGSYREPTDIDFDGWLRANVKGNCRCSFESYELDGDADTSFFRIYFSDNSDAALCELTHGQAPPVLTRTIADDVPPDADRYLFFSSPKGVGRYWPRRCGDGYFRAEFEGPRGGSTPFKSKKLKTVREWCRKKVA